MKTKVKKYSLQEANGLIYDACIKTLKKSKNQYKKDVDQLETKILAMPTIREGEYIGICKDDIILAFAIFKDKFKVKNE